MVWVVGWLAAEEARYALVCSFVEAVTFEMGMPLVH